MATHMARLKGSSSLAEFTYTFSVVTSGGLSLDNSGEIEVDCSSAVVISSPTVFSTSAVRYEMNDGVKTYSINDFSTDDTNCPIASYQCTSLSSGVTS